MSDPIKALLTGPGDEVDILARTLWGEARGEGRVGMHAVANVIVNRVASPGWWGDDIIEVCLKPWQFSAWNDQDANYKKLLAVTVSDSQFAIARHLAVSAVNGTLPDITGGATHYHTVTVDPDWDDNFILTATIGRHEFFIRNL